MIKIALGLSIVLNLVLGYFLFTRRPEKEIIERERLIIETHQGKAEIKKDTPKDRAPKTASPQSGHEVVDPDDLGFDYYEFREASEKMETARLEFFTDTLGMTEEQIAEHNRIREDFRREMSKFYEASEPMRELTFDQRRAMIDVEEDFHRKLEKLHGKKNWQRYRKFIEEYNTRGFRKQQEDGRPYVHMGL